MDEFKRLSRDLVAHGAILDYYQDTIQIPNGNVAKWDFIKHNGAAAVVPVDDNGRLIMVRQYRNALDRYTLEIPAGGLQTPQEPTRDAAIRELAEETGYFPYLSLYANTAATVLESCISPAYILSVSSCSV